MRHAIVLLCAAVVLALGAAPLWAQDKDAPAAAEGRKMDVAEQLKLIDAASKSLVRVEYTLQYDKGEAPTSPTLASSSFSDSSPEEAIQQERPLEMPGYLVAKDTVVTLDRRFHPRFVKAIKVRFGDELVDATIDAVALGQEAAFLKLASPLKAAEPLAFGGKKDGPMSVLTHGRSGAVWFTTVVPMTETAITYDGGSMKTIRGLGNALVLDGDGKPITLTMTSQLDAAGAWKAPPAEWKTISMKDLQARLDALEKASRQCLLRVELTFRSPRKSGQTGYDDDGGSGGTVNVAGVLTGPRQVLVLAPLKPKITARLQDIRVYGEDGKPVKATFASSLTDYDAFMADLASDLSGAVKLSSKPILAYDEAMLLGVDLRIQGENRVEYLSRARIVSFDLGWRQQVYPYGGGGQFLFDPADGTLVAMPIGQREKSGESSRYRGGALSTATVYLAKVLGDLAANTDPSNVPLSEQDENRVAWLGVELQPLDRELARANKLSEMTRDGQTGAIVSFVYKDSPAEAAGLKVGDVLLRLHAADHPKPIDVVVTPYMFSERPFPWDRWDELPESMFDRLPTPWPPVETAFTRELTDLGFGKKFQVEYVHDGKVSRVDMTVQQSPPHYETAARYKSKPLGLTAAEVTYEVRRYFQRSAGDGGVIVTKVEPGSRASVAGIKPFETITHVNDQPVKDVKDFENLLSSAEGGELRLAVKRVTTGRVVKIRMDAAKTTRPSSGPSSGPAAAAPAAAPSRGPRVVVEPPDDAPPAKAAPAKRD
jgi:hypothetical protein